MSVDPSRYCCTVLSDGRGAQDTDVAFPNLSQDARGCGGEVSVPQSGQRVLLHYHNGRPLIVQLLPIFHDVGLGQANTPRTAGVDIGNTVRTSPRGDADYRGNMPGDLLEGDRIKVGPRGECVGVLAGSGAIFGASPFAQILAAAPPNEGLSVRARKLSMFTDFGNVIFDNVGGKTSFAFRGGSDQLLESSSARQNWTVRAEIGTEGNLGRYGFFDREGKVLNQTVIETSGGENREVAGPANHIYRANVYSEVTDGLQEVIGENHAYSLDGSLTENIGGSVASKVSQNFDRSVKNDRFDGINRDWIASVGRTFSMDVSGDLQALPGAVGYQLRVSNGSMLVDVGAPGTELTAAESGFKLTVYPARGNIEMKTLLGDVSVLAPAGKIEMTATQDIKGTCTNFDMAAAAGIKMSAIANAEVTAGGQAIVNAPKALIAAANGVATEPAVLWSELMKYLDALTQALDTHQHPTTYPFTPTSAPLIPTFNLVLQGYKPLISSKKVTFGG